ncbi:hypothetical protein MKW92_016273, partial [Papaver armeniacum]
GGPRQQQHQRQLQLGVAKRSLEQGESQMRQQRQRLPGPANQPHQAAGAWPRLWKPSPFPQPYPPAAFQQPPYHVPMQGHQTRPLPQSQQSAVPFQFQPLLAGINSSSSASSSQSQLQSHQHHSFSTGSFSSAAVVGHHQAPPDPHDFSTIQFTGDGENSGWDTDQERLKQRYQRYQLRMQGHQSQPAAVPSQSQSQQQLTSSSSSAAVVEQPIIQLRDDENTDEAQKQLNQGRQ